MRAPRTRRTASPDQVLAGSVTALLLVLLAILTVWGRFLFHSVSLEGTAVVVTLLFLIGAIGLATLFLAGAGRPRRRE